MNVDRLKILNGLDTFKNTPINLDVPAEEIDLLLHQVTDKIVGNILPSLTAILFNLSEHTPAIYSAKEMRQHVIDLSIEEQTEEFVKDYLRKANFDSLSNLVKAYNLLRAGIISLAVKITRRSLTLNDKGETAESCWEVLNQDKFFLNNVSCEAQRVVELFAQYSGRKFSNIEMVRIFVANEIYLGSEMLRQFCLDKKNNLLDFRGAQEIVGNDLVIKLLTYEHIISITTNTIGGCPFHLLLKEE